MRTIQRSSRRRTVSLSGSVLFSLLVNAGPVLALSYLNASPAGSQFPQWDGGDTELEFADVNADGNVDLISIGDHGSPYINTDEHGIMVYFTDGAGGWSIHMEGNFGYGGICAGDANGDGLMDVGYGMHHDYSGTDFGNQLLEVALGDGTGTAWVPWDDGLATNGESWGMGATDFADFDHDGDLDLAAGSFGCCNGVHVYRNNGDGTWTQTFARSGGNSTMFLCTGDVNGDGHPDFAASSQQGCVFLGDGAGGFTSADTGLPALGSLGLRGVALGDVDADGCDDLAFVRDGGVHVYVWRTDHWESASNGLPTSGSYRAAQLFDLDLDGHLDVAAMAPGLYSVWLGNGLGTWSAGGGFALNAANDVAAFRVGGDIDHNGRADVALLQEEGSFYNYRNYLYVYRESTPPAEPFVQFHEPPLNRALRAGAAHRIRWASARSPSPPAVVRLELSVAGPAGPWLPIADSVPDNGTFQWIVPDLPTGTAHIRGTMTQDGVVVSGLSAPFRILPGDPAGAPSADPGRLPGPAARLIIAPNPSKGTTRVLLSDSSGSERLIPSGGRLQILDATGRLVRSWTVPLASQEGLDWIHHGVEWDGRASDGRTVPPGVYLVRLDGWGRAVSGKATVGP